MEKGILYGKKEEEELRKNKTELVSSNRLRQYKKYKSPLKASQSTRKNSTIVIHIDSEYI